MTAPPSAPAEPRPAASVLLVREAPPGAPEPLEVYMIRRHRGMKFLGGYYAFPGGKVEPGDAAPMTLARCRGLDVAAAEAVFPGHGALPALAFWVTAVRELLEETGVVLACDDAGRAVVPGAAAEAVTRVRKALVADEAPFGTLLAREGWWCDVRPLRYLSHFITPTSSPIRFTARFFLCPAPEAQEPALLTTETSEGFWIHPGEGYRRFVAGDMAMAEPAEYALGYLAQFRSLGEVLEAHADGRHKFHGVIDRIHGFWADFDWRALRFPGGAASPGATGPGEPGGPGPAARD
ncbi:MAG TPA: hypothetical protein VNN07_11325 [Candidatus Tectomicrobia bacterium]|nr:hypothetical protein [Candidatus Tectomicrobia bacterium]